MTKIAVDAMGSDAAPVVEVDGAIQAAEQYGLGIVLVGQEERIRELLAKQSTSGLSIEVVHRDVDRVTISGPGGDPDNLGPSPGDLKS